MGEPGKEQELAELQRMVSENEQALSRAKDMISELRAHLRKQTGKSAPASKPRRKN